MTPSAPNSCPSDDQDRWLSGGFYAAMILACAIALSPNMVDPDLWGHVLYGEELLADGELPQTATHTFTAPDHRWVNHENLSEIALALGYRHLGPVGLMSAKCLLGLFVIWLMIRAAQRQCVGMFALCATLLLVAFNLTPFWSMRPQLLSFVCFAVLMALLEKAFARWSESGEAHLRWLLPVPVVMVVWTNSHGGFVAGLCVLGVYLAGRGIEALVKRGRAGWPMVGKLAAVGIVSALATLINPYGPGLHQWMIGSLGQPRPEISEWSAPSLTDDFFLAFALLVGLAIVGLAGSERRRDFTKYAVMAIVLWQAVTHLRHIAFFALLCGFWLPVHVESWLVKLRKVELKSPEGKPLAMQPVTSRWPARLLYVGLAFTFVLLIGKLSTRLGDLPVERSSYPVDAVAYMAEQDISGKLVVSFNWAQYAIAALAPQVKVSFDGRFRTCYPQEVVDMNFDFILGRAGGKRYRSPDSGPLDPTQVLHYGEPDLVLVDRRFPHSVAVMQWQDQQREWVLLYQDGLAQLYGRREKYDLPESPAYLPVAQRRISDRMPEGSVTWPAIPTAGRAESIAGERALRSPTLLRRSTSREDS
ncbi:MAG: hypothetical protein WDZ59_10325 [Pirellulales bacterium]